MPAERESAAGAGRTCAWARDVAERRVDRRATLTIDLDAIVRNFKALQGRVLPAELAAVVKADAYGLGVVPVASALQAAGCARFFVAELSEAAALTSALGRDCDIHVLNGLQPGDEAPCADLGVIPVLNSLDQARRWSALARARGERLRAAIQVDSGMSRLGMAFDEVATLVGDADLLAGIEPVLLMSHFACADDPEATANARQIAKFRCLALRFGRIRLSLANSGGAFLGGDAHFDLVRAGIALYGGAPQIGREAAMEPVVRLEAPVIQLRSVPAGAGLGYGLTGAVDRPRRVAVIAAGYADGWPRRLGNRGVAFVGDVRVPIVGRVSMDSMTIDVTDIPAEAVAPGSMVELLGRHQGVDDVADAAGTISYEILTQLGQRLQRRYVSVADGERGQGVAP